ncbi:hypothetical protein [Kaistia adipata]|uniref:hypothetical protein n=1 Tax=Kaistia adipata TaxID=166954 RepID=UPI00048AE359|nr:hypothetical protein [Kaistia adipata]
MNLKWILMACAATAMSVGLGSHGAVAGTFDGYFKQLEVETSAAVIYEVYRHAKRCDAIESLPIKSASVKAVLRKLDESLLTIGVNPDAVWERSLRDLPQTPDLTEALKFIADNIDNYGVLSDADKTRIRSYCTRTVLFIPTLAMPLIKIISANAAAQRRTSSDKDF